MTELVPLISNLGFPIFVAVFFMTKMNKTIEANTAALQSVEKAVVMITRGDRPDE